MSFNEERFFERLDTVRMGNYDIKYDEMNAILRRYHSDVFSLVVIGMKYGFMKGERKAKNERKRNVKTA